MPEDSKSENIKAKPVNLRYKLSISPVELEKINRRLRSRKDWKS